MLKPFTYLCGVATKLYTAHYEVVAYSPHHAAEEYCLMYEGGWGGDHFNLEKEEPRVVSVMQQGERSEHKVVQFSVTLAEDSDQEYVIKEV